MHRLSFPELANETLRSKRLVFASVPEGKDAPDVKLSEVQLSETHRSQLGTLQQGIRTSLDTVKVQLGTKHGEAEVVPASESFQAILRSGVIKRSVRDGKNLFIESDEGIQHYEIDAQRKEINLVAPDVSKDADVQKLFQKSEVSTFSGEELAAQLTKFLRKPVENKDMKKPLILSASIGRDKGVSIETLLWGDESKPDHRLRTGAPAKKEFFKAPEGQAIQSYTVATSESPAGVLASMTIRTAAPSGEEKEHKMVVFFDARGEVVYQEPSEGKKFQKYQLPNGIECVNLGNKVLLRKGPQIEAVNVPSIEKVIPYLGALKEVHTSGKTMYINFQAIPSGNITLAIDHEKGTLNTDKGLNGIIKGDIVFFESEKDRLFVMQPDGGKGSKERVMEAMSVQEVSKEKKVQALGEAQAKELAVIIDGTREKLQAALDSDTLESVLGDLESFLKTIRRFTVDPDVRGFSDALRRAGEELETVKSQALREESVRRAQIKRLEVQEQDFSEKVGKLFEHPQTRIGGMMDLLRSFQVLRAGRIADLNNPSNISQLPEDRLAASYQVVYGFDERVNGVRKSLQEKVTSEISEQKTDGVKQLRLLLQAEGEMGYLQVAGAKNELDKSVKFYELVKELQKNPEAFFTGTHEKDGFKLDAEGTAAKDLMNTETVRGQELSPEDVLDDERVQVLHMAHIDRLYPEVYARAVRKNVDPDQAKKFEEALQVITGQAVRLRELTSMTEIDDGAARIEREIQALEDGVYKAAALEHSPVHRAMMVKARKELGTKSTEAKTHLLRETSRERMQLGDMIREKTQNICRAIDTASRRQDADRVLPPEQQSRSIWARVQQLVRGYDLQGQTKRAGLPDQAYSEHLSELFTMVERLETRFQDRERANEVWRELRNALQKAMNRIESDKGYAKKEGHYVLDIPEFYQQRLGRRIEAVELPLSGADEVQPLQLETMVDVKDGTPRLMMTLLGNDEFRKEVLVGRRYSRALPALQWEAPAGDSPLRAHYKGPEVSRTSVALSLLIDRLPLSEDGQFFISELPNLVEEHREDLSGLEAALAELLQPHLTDLKKALGLELNSDQMQTVARDFAVLASRKELDFVELEQGGGLKPELKATEVLKEQLEAAKKFRARFEKPLTILNQAVQRNQQRISRQMGLAQQQEASRLPHDFRETGLNVVQMAKLLEALQTCQSSPDKQAIVMLGDFGSGKTMLATALANRKRQRMHMINGNKFGGLQSLDPYSTSGNVSDQLSLLAATLTQMTGVIAFLDEGQFMPADVLNSLFDLLDVRGELSVSIEKDAKEDVEDVNIYEAKNRTKKGNTFIMSGNLSYTIENRSTGERMTVDFVLPEALSRRVVKVSTDDIEEQNEFLWIASYIERGSGDLGIHPDDVKYLISKRLELGDYQRQEVSADDANLKTDFTLDPQRLQELVKAIDYRCLAAKTLVNIQKASRRTRQMGGDISKLGVPPCWMTAVGGGNVKTLMPLLTHEVKDEAQARSLIREQLMGNTDDRGPSHKEENILFLEHITGDWSKYAEADWKRALSDAERIREEGLSPNPVVGPLRAIGGVLEKLKGTLEAAGGEHEGVIRELGAQLQSAVQAFENAQGRDGERKAQMEQLVASLSTLSTALAAQPHANGNTVQPITSVSPALIPRGITAPETSVLRLDADLSGKLSQVVDLILGILQKPKGTPSTPSKAPSTGVQLKDTMSP